MLHGCQLSSDFEKFKGRLTMARKTIADFEGEERQAEIERGDILFAEDGFGNAELIEQMIAFPDVLHDDRVDALLISVGDDDVIRDAIIDV